MDRRDFLRQVGLGLVAGWAWGRLPWPSVARAASPELRLAFLADAHLKNGDGRRPEALSLARAVAEINALSPPPDVVLFAGDLAHQGRPDALDLGRKILDDLSAPWWAVRGEGDCGRGGATPWVRRFGSPYFARTYQGVQVIGLDTGLLATSRGAVFSMGPDQRQWLAQTLAPLDPATPLVVVSHAPLARLFHPWRQWTQDAAAIEPLLCRFDRVLCLHGHVHGAEASPPIPPAPPLPKDGMIIKAPWPQGNWGGLLRPLADGQQRHPGNLFNLSLPSTAWPMPAALQGTPVVRRPGLGPKGCGWVLVSLRPESSRFLPQIWQA